MLYYIHSNTNAFEHQPPIRLLLLRSPEDFRTLLGKRADDGHSVGSTNGSSREGPQPPHRPPGSDQSGARLDTRKRRRSSPAQPVPTDPRMRQQPVHLRLNPTCITSLLTSPESDYSPAIQLAYKWARGRHHLEAGMALGHVCWQTGRDLLAACRFGRHGMRGS